MTLLHAYIYVEERYGEWPFWPRDIYNEGVKGSLSVLSNNLSGVELWRFAHANRVMNSNQRWRCMFTDNLIPETCNFALHFV